MTKYEVLDGRYKGRILECTKEPHKSLGDKIWVDLAVEDIGGGYTRSDSFIIDMVKKVEDNNQL